MYYASRVCRLHWKRGVTAAKFILSVIFAPVLAFILLAPAYADVKCPSEAENGQLDLAIDHCTESIGSGRLSAQDLARNYSGRGFAYSQKKDYDRAIQDYNRALQLAPNDAGLLTRRATAYEEKRQYERALADYEAAAQINPKSDLERSKGFVLFYLGRMTQSAEAFERYMKSRPPDTSAMLFRYLAEAKIGSPLIAARELESDASRVKQRAWPAEIVDFYLGKIDEKTIFAATHDPDPKIKNEKTCAANFHAGESRLFRAYVSGAIPLLRAAAKDCPSHLYESHGAGAELQRLGQK
jgi:lipoprotein NlpI